MQNPRERKVKVVGEPENPAGVAWAVHTKKRDLKNGEQRASACETK